jgi:hypothetical protein
LGANPILFSYQTYALYTILAENISALSNVIAENAKSALVFNDAEAATETMAALKVRPITMGCLAPGRRALPFPSIDLPENKIARQPGNFNFF